MIIKFCGIKSQNDIKLCNILKPTMIGLIFAESPRKIPLEQAENILKRKSPNILSVAVFKNQSLDEVCKIVKKLKIDYVQLHGNEDLDYIRNIRKQNLKVIKAIEVYSYRDLEKGNVLKNQVDFILLDRPKGTNIDILSIAKEAEYKFIVAGGINEENIDRYLEINPLGIDISSGIETDGNKDYQKMKKIILKVRGYL
ncbi:phosphoribosylanthranilate isomerase [Caldicellulosiruptoraceae bacterium PP1]